VPPSSIYPLKNNIQSDPQYGINKKPANKEAVSWLTPWTFIPCSFLVTENNRDNQTVIKADLVLILLTFGF